MTKVTALAGTGALGTGFSAESLRKAMLLKPDFIGCDAGSTDGGPHYLGSGESMCSRAAIKRDMKLLLVAAVEAGIPLLIGSAGTGGGKPHLDKTVALVKEIAAEEDLSFELAAIDSELDRRELAQAYREGRITPLDPAPEISEHTFEDATRIVAQMGAEPFIRALEGGAQVVIAGRASDAAIYAAVPMMKGCDPGATWHAAKVLECGAASVEQRRFPDCMMAVIDGEGFTIFPPNESFRATQQSIAAHTLYENADPFLITEPSGKLDTHNSTYEQVDERSVRVRGSEFKEKPQYDVRLEGVRLAGYRSIVIGGVRDPIVLRQIDHYFEDAGKVIEQKAYDSLELTADVDYQMHFRIYGKDACLGELEPKRHEVGHEIGVVIDIVAKSQTNARDLAKVAMHTALHHPVPEWGGLLSNLAFPYSPPEIDVGPVYEFCLNHVLALTDPVASFGIEYQKVG